jgi:hypothetical protein
MAHDSSDRGLAIDDFHTLMERVTVMRADYQQLLMDRDYLLEIGEMYSGIHGDTLDGREETHLVEHGDSSPLQQNIVLGDHLHNRSNYLSEDGGRVIGQ